MLSNRLEIMVIHFVVISFWLQEVRNTRNEVSIKSIIISFEFGINAIGNVKMSLTIVGVSIRCGLQFTRLQLHVQSLLYFPLTYQMNDTFHILVKNLFCTMY